MPVAKPKAPRKPAKRKPVKRKPVNKGGRPSYLENPAVQNAILKMIKSGATIVDACAAAAISETAFYEWKQRGRDEPGSIYADFLIELEKALASTKVEMVANVKRHGKKEWRASAFWLSRRYPSEYGELPRDVTIHNDTKDERSLENVTDEKLLEDNAKAKARLVVLQAQVAAAEAPDSDTRTPGPDEGLGDTAEGDSPALPS